MTREFLADFETGDVTDASITHNPDAIVPITQQCPGPAALIDTTAGLLAKGWYARVGSDGLTVYLGEAYADPDDGWKPELTLFSVTGAPIDSVSIAFDSAARPVVAMERAGDIWVRYWSDVGGAYTVTNLGPGTFPAMVHQAPDSVAWAALLMFYQKGTRIYYRRASAEYAVEQDTEYDLAANTTIQRAILDPLNRIHLTLATHNPTTGKYALDRVTATGPDAVPPCFDIDPVYDVIIDGVDTIFILLEDATITTTCDVQVDFLLVGEGGDSGGVGNAAPDAKLWLDVDGVALDPMTDTPPDEHIALGGGTGGDADRDGKDGASGGGGGARSPSANSMWTGAGLGSAPQGYKGGGGQSTWGILPSKRASSGGGGGYGGPGTGGAVLGGMLLIGKPGPGAKIPNWPAWGPRGGKGYYRAVKAPEPNTGNINGGGGSGGVRTVDGIVLLADQSISVTVPGGVLSSSASVGQGGDGPGGGGGRGMVAVRVRRYLPDDAAELSGGTEFDAGLWHYHKFTAAGVLTVVTAGWAEALLVGGGGGGGSDAGGGGGGGDVREVTLDFREVDDYDISPGDGGAGGTSGGVGANGEDSSIADIAEAYGGGGGAGNGTAAGQRATGGGGHGDEGSAGFGIPLRGYSGGDGKGYDLSAGGSARHAGGGGGAGEEGGIGAELETTGGELDDDWYLPSAHVSLLELEADTQQMHITTFYETWLEGLLEKNVAADEMLVQARVLTATDQGDVGIMARAEYATPGDPDTELTGYNLLLNEFYGTLRLSGSGGASSATIINEWQVMQLYVADDVQEGSCQDEDQAYALDRRSLTDATFNGTSRSFGIAILHRPSTNNADGRWDYVIAFASKYLTVGGLSAGWKAQVLDENDVVLAEATESGGTALVDLSRFGDGATGVAVPVPLGGFDAIRIVNAGDVEQAYLAASVYPGGEYDYNAGDIEIRILAGASASDDVPLTGILGGTLFDELTPGPEHGDGGSGKGLSDDWAGALAYDKLGGGGGAGGELVVGGLGGDGGGGAGGFDSTDPPEDGVANTGGGGGGSGDSTVPGGDGGSGLIVLRTPRSFIISLTTSGYVFSDDFDRADNDVPGNGWIEERGDWDVVSGKIATSGTLRQVMDNLAEGLNTHFTQALVSATTGGQMGLLTQFLWNGGNERGFGLRLNVATGLWELGWYTPSFSTYASVADAGIVSGAELPAQLYFAPNIQQGWGNGNLLTQALAFAAGNSWYAGLGHGRTSGTPSGTGDDFLWCRGKYVTVTGLESGWKAKIVNATDDVVAEATESGGTATIDASRWGGATELCPLTGWPSLVVTDGSDNVIATYSAPVYPGHALAVTSV